LIRQDLLLVFDDRLLIPQDPGLIAEQHRQPALIPEDLLLIRDDYLLIPDCCLCHAYSRVQRQCQRATAALPRE
jgi:hypothetical protein